MLELLNNKNQGKKNIKRNFCLYSFICVLLQ